MQAYITGLKAHIGEKKDLFQLKSVLFNNMQNIVSCSQPVSDDNIKPLLASYQTKLGPSSADRLSGLDKEVSEIERSYIPRHVSALFEAPKQEVVSEGLEATNQAKV
jgi:hypothetical protein